LHLFRGLFYDRAAGPAAILLLVVIDGSGKHLTPRIVGLWEIMGLGFVRQFYHDSTNVELRGCLDAR